MSLAGDFNMYYQGTVLYVNQGGARLPFIVSTVDGGSTRESLTFYGNVIVDEAGHVRSHEFRFSDLDFTLPSLGWCLVDGTPRWVTYKVVKTVKKGLHPVRLANFAEGNFSRRNIWALTQPFEGRISDDWCTHNGKVLFKGFEVGDVNEDGSFTLISTAEYLVSRLELLRPDLQINVA